MENELILNMEQIIVTQGTIEFTEYENVKQQALKLAAHIEKVEVNDENLKQSKKLLAAVNKRVKDLEDRRITIKKILLQPYQDFEMKVKEIVNIVGEADAIVRNQVRQMEEAERERKQKDLEFLFDVRKQMYKYSDLIQFEQFLQPQYLNKSFSINKVEDEMIQFLEKISNDIAAIESMEDAQAVLSLYFETFNLSAAIAQVNKIKERKRQIEGLKEVEFINVSKKFYFTVFDEKDLLVVEMFMQNNNIKYQVEDGF